MGCVLEFSFRRKKKELNEKYDPGFIERMTDNPLGNDND